MMLADAPQLRRECHDCGKLVRLPALPAGVDACCPRCDAVLRHNRGPGLAHPLALSVASLAMAAVTLGLPFLEVQVLGRARLGWVPSGAETLYTDGLGLLSLVVLATLVLMPLLKIGLLLGVLLGLQLRRTPPWLYLPFRWYRRVAPWAMLEVFLFGALVSYTRLADLAHVVIEPAAWALAILTVLMLATDLSLDSETVWQQLTAKGATPPPRPATHAERPIGCHACHLLAHAPPHSPCPRCGATLHPRKPDSLARCWALIAAAALLYIPANAFPVMNITSLGRGGPHTILGGVVEFVDTGFWPLALIVFTASVLVPMLKLVGLVTMLLAVHFRSALRLRDRTRLYRVVDAIGRWSMIDVFVVSVLVSLVQFGQLATIRSDIGAVCFAGVVVLTMLAAESFDPRLMWDAVEEPA